MKKVVHLIVGLGKGGAETMLYQVLKYRTDSDLVHSVVSLGASYYFEEPIRKLGVNVTVLQFKKTPLSSLVRLFKIVKDADTLCCWMYHANLIGYYIGSLAKVKRIVWCVRHGNIGSEFNKERTLKINRLCSKLSKNVTAITYNGKRSREVHEALGYSKEKGVILNNGCDCEEYAPSVNAGIELRREIGVSHKKRIILSVTKDHPIKDVPTFIRAYAALHSIMPNVVAVMCGNGIELGNKNISLLCRENNLIIGKDIYLLGMRNDVSYLLAACDLYVLHSAGEAFPNTLVQAMACGCLCLATDVGDAREILIQPGGIVESKNANALLKKMQYFMMIPFDVSKELRLANRNFAVRKYDIKEIVKCYERIF